FRPRTPDPTCRTSATHSWPIAKGPWNGTLPQMLPTTGSMTPKAIPACIARETGRWMGRVSPSQRPATKGRTIASVGSWSSGALRSPHSNTPERRKRSSRTAVGGGGDERLPWAGVEQKGMRSPGVGALTFTSYNARYIPGARIHAHFGVRSGDLEVGPASIGGSYDPLRMPSEPPDCEIL